jgi:hypothetical protein
MRRCIAVAIAVGSILGCYETRIPAGGGGGAAYPASETQAVAAKTCSNDYECAYGQTCIKQHLQFEGVCAQAVNQYGAPVYTPPRNNSWGPGGPGECVYDTQCPFGFTCIKGDALMGTCMR